METVYNTSLVEFVLEHFWLKLSYTAFERILLQNHKIMQVMSNDKLSCPNVSGKGMYVNSQKVSKPVLVI